MSLARIRRRFPGLAEWIAHGPSGAIQIRPGPAPALALDGVQLRSRFDPRAEAELQARLVPEGAERATVYGCGQTELVARLLARPALRALRVVVLAPEVARAVIEHEAPAWLDDPRVELVHPRDCDELELPFAASPADLRLAGDEGARLRDLVVLELATPLLREHRREQERELAARRAESARRFASDPPVAELFGTRPGARLCVAAAGPTLARHYAELRERAHELVAVDAALRPLLAAGVVPALVVTQDAHPEGMRRVFDVRDERLARVPLVYGADTPPEVLAAWPGPRHADRDALFSSGSVLHPAVDLAVRLGAREVALFGADFALVGGASHVAGCAWSFRGEVVPGSAWVLDGDGERVASLPNLVGYLRDLERYVARHPRVDFVVRARAGAAIRGTRVVEVPSAG
jgi:hypothetical protein